MGYFHKLNSLHKILHVPGFDQRHMVPFIFRGLIAGRKTEDLVRLILSKPMSLRPFLPQDRADPLFGAVLSHYAGGNFAKNGIKTMAEWVELINNLSAPGLMARGMLLKDRNVHDSLKLSPEIALDKSDQVYNNKVDHTFKVISGWQKSVGSLKIIEDYLFYHAEEISKQLALVLPQQKQSPLC